MDKKQAKVAKRQIATIQEYKHIFDSVAGKKVLNDLMRNFHIMGSGFDKDPYMHAFRAGEQNVVKYILMKMKQDTNAMLKRLDSAEQERRQEHEGDL